MQLGNTAADILRLHQRQRTTCQHLLEAEQVAPVIAQGVWRKAPLSGQKVEIRGQDCRHAGRIVHVHNALLVTRASAAETISPIRSR